MGTLYRSEEVCLCQLFLQTEAAYACVAELGELGLVQFRDLNPDVSAFQRKFVNEVRRCDEMERKLRFLEKEIKKDAIPMLDSGENPDAPQPREMIDLEATFEKLENELREVNTNEEMLKKNFLELTELKHILRKTQTFFDEREDMHALQSITDGGGPIISEHGGSPSREQIVESKSGDDVPAAQRLGELNFVAGVILRERLPAFEKLLWRACRGNVFLRQAEITEPLEDPATGDQVNKSVFIIFFQGDQLKTRVKKICEGFRATLYPCPDTPQERREMAIGVMTRIEDLKTVLGQTQDHRHRVLVAAAKNVRMWFTKVRKIKAIYHTLNFFNLDVTQKCLIAECWCPTADLDKIQLALKRGTEESGSSVPSILNKMETDEERPTYHRTNKFTRGFQNIVDAYGMANYREINPAPYTIITFPFLFALMFGDAGHGLIMFLSALFFVLKERQLEARRIKDEIFQTFFGGRYIILMMGLFSIYTGFIYNDFYSKSINIFGSKWKNPYPDKYWTDRAESSFTLNPEYAFQNETYPFGFDPVWNIASNKLNFINSFKMKMSVIVGVSHMAFGVFLSLLNYQYFRQPLDIYCQFIPQLVFLLSIFGYLCILIFNKWIRFSVYPKEMGVGIYPGSHCAPSLLIGLINMAMFKNDVSGFLKNETWNSDNWEENGQCYLNKYYVGQSVVERCLVFVACVCVPLMLLTKPAVLYLRNRNTKRQARYDVSVRADVNSDDVEVVHHENSAPSSSSHGGHGGGGHGHGHGEDFDLGDVMILQAIHTIEFCLGCISHTASYLRLWALSLAHAQLSEVLWSMILRMAFTVQGYSGAVLVYLIFWPFACLTVAVLVLMEGLSAFLHALRLHWVEFQSKFYGGSGYAFAPFSFDVILDQARQLEGD